MGLDALSDVLRTVRLTGAVFFEVTAHAPWVAEQPPAALILRQIRPGADHLIAYHVVIEGSCYGALLDGEAVLVAAREVIVFTRGDPHTMASSPGMRAEPETLEAFDALPTGQLPFRLCYGGSGPETKVVCGFLACDARPFNPLLQHLPPVIKVGEDESGWLGAFIGLATTESARKRAGGESILAKLSELMFIEVVRRYVETLPARQTGWLAGLRDPCVGAALSRLHARPAHDWTIEELARAVGVSRSVLAERFTHLVGTPPMHYLAQWRMQLASGLLSCGNSNIASVANEIGYDSEAAFSRAFKKLVGMPPSVWRRQPRLHGS